MSNACDAHVKKICAWIICNGIIFFGFTPAYAEMDGFYAGAQLGYASTHLHTSDLVVIANAGLPVVLPDLQKIVFAYRLSFGYQLNSHAAIEIGYRSFSNTEIGLSLPNAYNAHASSKLRAWDFMAKGMVPFTQKLTGYAKLGIAYVRANANGSASIVPPYTAYTHGFNNTLDPAFALGFSYALKPNVPVDASWNHIQSLGGSGHGPNSDFYALGVTYYFG